MKLSIVTAVGFALVSAAAVGQDTAVKKAPAAPANSGLKDLREKASYSLGLSLGRNLKTSGVEIDPDILARGIRDALSGGKALLTDDEMKQVMMAFQQEIQSKQMAAAKGATEKNQKEGEAFLAANKTKPGVASLPSGLQYKVIKEGTGKTPRATDTVSTNYEGKLLDGTVFDSSYKRGQPASFPVNRVIAGWTEALQKMKVGSKWQLFIPANLAYGASPPPGSQIGPNSVLIFDIELLGIE